MREINQLTADLAALGIIADGDPKTAIAEVFGPGRFTVRASKYGLELGLTGADARVVPEGTLRGAESEHLVEVPLQDYLDLVAPLQERRVQEALEGPDATIAAERFALAVRTERPASAVVFLLDAGGGPARLAWPADGPWTADSGRLEPAGDHVIPRRAVDPDLQPLFDPGLLVPVDAGEVHVLIGLRPEPLGPELERSVRDELEAAGERTRLESWLGDQGFEVQRLTVRERMP